jgi:hypothetical protein
MTRSGALGWWQKELPKHILYLYKDNYSPCGWKEYTRAEHNAKKKERQEANILRKRHCLKRVPCYIYVFFINSDFLFGGFYIAIWSIHGIWYLKRTQYKHLFEKIRRHLPLGLLPIIDDDIWFNEFCKKYPMKPRGIQRPRGKYLVHCILDSYNNLIDICL